MWNTQVRRARRQLISLRSRVVLVTVAMIAALIPLAATPAAADPVTDLTIGQGREDAFFNLTFGPIAPLLRDTDNFGPAGTVEVDSLTLAPEAARVTAEYLAGLQIYFDGWTPDTLWEADEVATIVEWVDAGGVIILNEDSTTATALGTAFGAPTLVSAGVEEGEVLTIVAAAHGIADGPFGTVTEITPNGTLGHFGSLGAPWTVVAEDEDGNTVLATRDFGDGHVILSGDEGLFQAANEEAALNAFAYALGFTDDAIDATLTVSGPGDQQFDADDSVDLDFTTAGGDSSDITWRASELPPGLSIDADTGNITGTVTGQSITEVVVTAAPDTGFAASTTLEIAVGEPLDITNPGDQAFEIGDTVNITFPTSGGDGSDITWTADTLPSGLSIDADTGAITGEPTAAGTTEVEVTATPDTGTTDSVTFEIVVTGGLNVTDPGDQQDRAGDPVSLDIETTGGDGSDITFSASGLPTNVSIDPDTGSITGTPTVVQTTTVTVTATPDTGSPGEVEFDWDIVANPEPVAVNDSVSVVLGGSIDLDICENDTLGDEPTTAAVTGTLPAGLTRSGCDITGTPTEVGTTDLTYTLTDDDGDVSDPATISIEVTDVPCAAGVLTMAGPTPGAANEDDLFGEALATGDFNGDDEPDLAVGAPGDKNGKGSVTVFGDPCGGGAEQRITQAGPTPGANEADDFFGNALAGGDFDGDGYDDLAIGVVGEDFGASRRDAGAVVVVYGSPAGLTDTGAQVLSQRGEVPGKAQADDRFGAALAAGDFNGDGFLDLLVGSPGEDVNGKSDAGAVYVFYGSASGLRTDTAEVFRQRGPLSGRSDAGDRLGFAVAAGDINGDGFAEAVFSAPYEDGDDRNTGIVHILRGSAGGVTTSGQMTEEGTDGADRFGIAVAIGEMTGDAFAELAVGVPGSNGAGAVHVYRGAASGLPLLGTVDQGDNAASNPTSGERFGDAIAIVDEDGDDRGELAIGVPGQSAGGRSKAGAVQIFDVNGGIDGPGGIFLTQSLSSVPGSAGTGFNFGAALAAADGVLYIGVPGADGDAGEAVVFD